MANPDIANGFIPVGTTTGADYHGKLEKVCFLAADETDTFIGDPVKLTGSSSDGYPSVAQCAAGDRCYGVLVSLEPDFTDESSLSAANYRRADTLRYGFVAVGDDVIYSVQEDSVGGALAATDVGENIDIIVGSGDTVTGNSGVELDSETAAETNSLVFRIVGLDKKQGNAIGTNARWLVTTNLSNQNNTTGV
jgi:hypothetical protein